MDRPFGRRHICGMSEQIRSSRRVTIEQFEALDDTGPYRLELVRGELVREPLPGELHGALTVRLGRYLDEFVQTRGLGRVVAHVGVVTERAPDTVRGPDLAFMAHRRMNRYPTTGALRTVPDLCVEILSPSNRAGETRQKVFEYLDAGARLVWVIDPSNRRVTEYRSKTEIRILGRDDSLVCVDVLPGFELALSKLFAP
jgi:Uma2 family endonuclease